MSTTRTDCALFPYWARPWIRSGKLALFSTFHQLSKYSCHGISSSISDIDKLSFCKEQQSIHWLVRLMLKQAHPVLIQYTREYGDIGHSFSYFPSFTCVTWVLRTFSEQKNSTRSHTICLPSLFFFHLPARGIWVSPLFLSGVLI